MAPIAAGFRKQVVLYLFAVILPCIVLVAVTYRMIQQEQVLARSTVAEECSRLAREIGNSLLARLQDLKLQEVDSLVRNERSASCRPYENREVVLIALVREGRLVLPWARDPRTEEAERSLARRTFAARIRRGEEEEFIRNDYSRASDHYRRALDPSNDPVQRGYASVLLARALNKAGRSEEALSRYRTILDLPAALVDEHGIPFLLYAVKPLIRSEDGLDEVSETINRLLNSRYWLSPAALFFAEDAVQQMIDLRLGAPLGTQAERLRKQILEQQQFIEDATGLQQRFPGLGLMGGAGNSQESDPSLWAALAHQNWLVGLSPEALDDGIPCIVVDGRTTLDAVENEFDPAGSRSIRFVWNPDDLSEWESLGFYFRNLGVRFSPEFVSSLVKQHSPQRLLYGLLVLLVLSLTLFGGYLLWRDVRRELRLAEMRSQFVSSVSHELKTPLTAIRMFAETMWMGRLKDPEDQQEYLETIVNESRRLTRLLNNVLDFSKIEQGKRQYDMQLAPLSEVIRAAARTMAYPLSQKGFQLQVHIDPDLPDLHMDGDSLEQAVLNLLSNAMKYSEEAGEIDLILTQDDGYAIIQVVDRGMGIDPEEQGRIFEKFYRIQAEKNERSTGTGLGLALVSHIVKAHRGRIEVDSSIGRGSTFSIHLPLGETS